MPDTQEQGHFAAEPKGVRESLRDLREAWRGLMASIRLRRAVKHFGRMVHTIKRDADAPLWLMMNAMADELDKFNERTRKT